MNKLAGALVIAFILCVPNAWGQFEDDRAVQLTRSAIQAERQAILAANLELDEEQAAVFWPLYQEYRSALESAISTRVKLLNEYFASYETLSDKEAMALLDKHIAFENEVLEVHSRYAKKMGKALPGKTVAKFFQIENKMNIIVEYEMAGEIPLIK